MIPRSPVDPRRPEINHGIDRRSSPRSIVNSCYLLISDECRSAHGSMNYRFRRVFFALSAHVRGRRTVFIANAVHAVSINAHRHGTRRNDFHTRCRRNSRSLVTPRDQFELQPEFLLNGGVLSNRSTPPVLTTGRSGKSSSSQAAVESPMVIGSSV